MPVNAGDTGSIPGLGRPPGEENSNLPQYSCLENSRDREAWWAAAHGAAKNGTQVSEPDTTLVSSVSAHAHIVDDSNSVTPPPCPLLFPPTPCPQWAPEAPVIWTHTAPLSLWVSTCQLSSPGSPPLSPRPHWPVGIASYFLVLTPLRYHFPGAVSADSSSKKTSQGQSCSTSAFVKKGLLEHSHHC